MKHVRKTIFWCHLLAGVIAGVVILIMSVTGALLAFAPQITRYVERDMRVVQPPQGEARRLGTQELFAKLREARPNAKPTEITIQFNPSEAASFSLGRDGVLYINPYTGAVTGEGAKKNRSFFRFIEDCHRQLGANGDNRPMGKAITGFCNAAFLILATTGLYIWWPRKFSLQHLKAITIFNFRLKGKARDFNWHNSIGFWCAPVLIFLTGTGVIISYQWASDLLYALTRSEKPAQQSVPSRSKQETINNAQRLGPGESGLNDEQPEIPDNLDQLWQRTEQQVAGWRAINLRLPQRAGAPISVSIDEGTSWNPFARSQLTLNSTTAEVIKWEPYANFNLGRTLRVWVRATHTGEAAGLPGQIIACIASLGGGFLVWTGLSLAWRRFRAWLTKWSSKQTKANAQPDMELVPEANAD